MEEALRKAKIPEEKIAELRDKEIDTEELSPDELDKVSGGGGNKVPSDFTVNDTLKKRPAIFFR